MNDPESHNIYSNGSDLNLNDNETIEEVRILSDEDNLDPLIVELQIERRRIESVLDHTIRRMAVVLCLPSLVAGEGELLRQFVDDADLECILELTAKYTQDKVGSSKSIKSDITVPHQLQWVVARFDPYLAEALEVLFNYPEIFQFCNKIIYNESEAAVTFLASIQTLKSFAMQKLNISAREERMHELKLRDIYHKNEAAKEEIKSLMVMVEEQRTILNAEIEEKNKHINIHRTNIENMKMKYLEDIQKRSKNSERIMVEDWRGSNERQVELQHDARNVSAQYENLLVLNLKNEKALRVKRVKIETQLLNWLQKYDTDMNERQNKFDEIYAGRTKHASAVIKSAPAEVWATPEETRQASLDSRRTSVSSRRASTVPLGVTNVRTEPRPSITPRDEEAIKEQVEPKLEDDTPSPV